MEIVSAPFFDDDYVRALYQGRAVSKRKVLEAYVKRLVTLLSSRKYDVLWMEKEIFPWLPAWFERLLSKIGVPYVVDYDDAVFHRYDQHPSAVVRSLLGHKIDAVMRHAALVIAGNAYLAERAKNAGAKRVEYLPSVVDVGRYQLGKAVKTEPFRVGWIGAPVTATYLDIIKPALEQLSREADIQIVLIGAGEANPFLGIPTTHVAWQEELDFSLAEHFDVGVMPLVDGPFERGKCGYKLIQYMAGGLPVVGSPVGVNNQIVEEGINGYLANGTEEWLQSLRTIMNDKELRVRLGQAGRRKAEQMYNLRVTAPKLLDLLSSVRRV
jgi:glycosyltransferase involved in cell wall biosynthesis